MEKLPTWANGVTNTQFELHRPRLFTKLPERSTMNTPFGHWDWPISFAKPELALLELLAEVSSETDFEVADKLFESATSLSPRLVMTLLQACIHVRAKRLFLWFGMRHGFSWYKHLELNKVDIGSGKRVIVKGGALDKTFLITVPRDMVNRNDVHGSEQSFF